MFFRISAALARQSMAYRYAWRPMKPPACEFMTPQILAAQVAADVQRALQEDVGAGDLTAALVPDGQRVRARILARESAVICGAPWAEAALRALDPQVQLTWLVPEGQRCAPDQVVLQIEGQARALLSAERTALNFLQLLSGVATKTATYVEAVRGTRAAIVDTRKTIPGLRVAQKYAVAVGGGVNHRIGLYDAVLIKENHIAAAGGIVPVLLPRYVLSTLGARPATGLRLLAMLRTEVRERIFMP